MGTSFARQHASTIRRTSNRMEQKPLASRISVVVLTHNRADELIATLERLLALPERPSIFVADKASGDHTVSLVRTLFPTVRVIECGANLGAAGRHRAGACGRPADGALPAAG